MANLTTGEQSIALPPYAPRRLLGGDGSGGLGTTAGLFLAFLFPNTLVVQHTSTGITPVFQAAGSGGDRYANSGRETLLIHNNAAGAITVTLKAQTVCNVPPGFLHDRSVTIAPGAEGSIGPAEVYFFNDLNQFVQIVYSATPGVTVALTAA